MNRRSFIKTTGTAGFGLVVLPNGLLFSRTNNVAAAIEESFTNPPAAARPFTWWHWMNGNISREGITLDLEAMARVGIGGVQCFNVGTGIPAGAVPYLGEEWYALTEHAIREADRLGLEFDMHNCPGWSSTGGPWITPGYAMKQVVWTESLVTGGARVSLHLPKPASKLDFYRDTYVLAVPATDAEKSTNEFHLAKVSTTEGDAPTQQFLHPDFTGGSRLVPSNNREPAYVVYEFNQPFEAHSVTVHASQLDGIPAERSGPGGPMLLQVSDDGVNYSTVAEIVLNARGIEMPNAASFTKKTGRFYKLVVPEPLFVAGFRVTSAPRLPDWPVKANYPGRGSAGILKLASEKKSGEIIPMDTSSIDPSKVIDISRHLSGEGHLTWDAPPGDWLILRFGYTAVERKNNAAPDAGSGLECDKYSSEAYRFHFEKVFDRLLPALKSCSNAGILIDSYEVGLQNWTPKMTGEFERLRGYSMVPYLPALTGRIVGSVANTEQFLWELRRTHADLMAENYHGEMARLCKEHGLVAYTEPYNNGPFEQMQVGSAVDINMGEFWTRGPHFWPSIKLAASIMRMNAKRQDGRQIIGAESFTADPVHGKWQSFPYAMKAHGDLMFTKGLNRMIFHRYAHQPHPTAVPGMTMGPWGFHFDRTNTWFEESKPWLDYLSRCQSLLQLGSFVGDILYYTGDDAPGEDYSMMAQPSPNPPVGFDFDFIDNQTLLNRVTIAGGKIMLPDNLSYRVLVLPEGKAISGEMLETLYRLVQEGMTMGGARPTLRRAISQDESAFEKAGRMAEKMWPTNSGRTISLGKGVIYSGNDLKTVFQDELPDFDYSSESGAARLNFIHRRTSGEEIYFVANRHRSFEKTVCKFRVTGAIPQTWDPETGEITPVLFYHEEAGQTIIPLQFTPAGACFVVFKKSGATTSRYDRLLKDGQEYLATKEFPGRPEKALSGITNNFTITAWVKPETDENFAQRPIGRGPASYAVYPGEGAMLYGAGHAAAGFIVARNGIGVYERTLEVPSLVMLASAPITGWAHVAVVYANGIPSVFLNGKKIATGQKSPNAVHPGTGSAGYNDGFHWQFEGDTSTPVLHNKALTGELVAALHQEGKPRLTQLPALLKGPGRKLFVFENGDYRLNRGAEEVKALRVKALGSPLPVTARWKVSFPPGLGAPPEITLDRLVPLNEHPNDGVKYFSGTATYTTRFGIDKALLSKDKEFFLDLGAVQVLARLRLNNQDLGQKWKPPFLFNISKAIKPGENLLEVNVTNLWPNRLIGDEQLPAENEYRPSGSTSSKGAIVSLPEWYKEGRPKPPGGRTTFATWKHFSADDPLLESGLVGPVLVRVAQAFEV